jgi:hypothetical protein
MLVRGSIEYFVAGKGAASLTRRVRSDTYVPKHGVDKPIQTRPLDFAGAGQRQS